jgi:5'-nucleotidase
VTLGHVNIDLDGRFVNLRRGETNLGNFVCDIIIETVNADCAIINSGTFRSDTLHPAGEFKLRDLKAILPFLDTIIVLQCTGRQLYEGSKMMKWSYKHFRF